MFLHPILQRELKLCHARQHLWIRIALLAKFFGHFFDDGSDSWIVFMGTIGNQQVELGIFLDLHPKVIERLNWRVASEEVLWARAEGDNFQMGKADEGTGNRLELGNHRGDIVSRAYGIFRNEGFQVTHA